MLDKLQKRKESGFTIVEVMIVLAIAGLIILVVFMAVPALQRSSRNTQRNSDASLVGSAVNECLNNRNGVIASCNQAGVSAYIDPAKLRQLTTITYNQGLPATTDKIDFGFGKKCAADGSGLMAPQPAGVSARAGYLLFNTEDQAGGLVGRCQEI